MQIEESWRGVCAVQAAKTLSNILNNPVMISDFLYRRGLERIERLLASKRDDISGYLLGQVMNCAMYSSKMITLSFSLVRSPLFFLPLDATDRFLAAVAVSLRRGAEHLLQRGLSDLAVPSRHLSAARSLRDVRIDAQHGPAEQFFGRWTKRSHVCAVQQSRKRGRKAETAMEERAGAAVFGVRRGSVLLFVEIG